MSTVKELFRGIPLSGFVGYEFKEFTELTGAEIKLVLAGALDVNLEKQFVPRYVFDIVLIQTIVKIGFIVFRVGLTEQLVNYGGHVGFEIDPEHRGHNYASKALCVLKPFIAIHSIDNLLITCDESNIASRKTIELAGGTLIEIKRGIKAPCNHLGIDCCYYALSIGEHGSPNDGNAGKLP